MKKLKTAVWSLGFVGVVAVSLVVLPHGYAAWRVLSASDDPAELSERRLDGHFDARVAAREINAALDAGDADLAASFVALARDRGVALDPALIARVDAATGAAASSRRGAMSFARGLVTGVPEDAASLAGTAVGDLFVFGDVRDAARESWHAARGEETDKVVLGLSLAGIAITAGTYATLGAAAPARLGVTLLKGAAKTEELGGRLARLVRFERTAEVVQVAGDLGRVQTKAGTRAAIEGLKLAEGPKDVERVAQLAAKEGGKTRAVIKLLGRGAVMLGAAAFELTSWVFWALINLLGLVVALKRWTERATLNSIRRSKARRARAMAAQALAPA
jgi:hypothetical protein